MKEPLPLEGMRAGLALLKAKANTKAEDSMNAVWLDKFKMWADFKVQRARVGDEAYYEVMNGFNVQHANEFQTPQSGIKCFLALRKLPDLVPERGELQDE